MFRVVLPVLLAVLTACMSSPFEAGDPAACPELFGYASYAYTCSADGRSILVCQGDAGQTSMCDQAARVVRACGCDELTTCSSSTQAVACVHVDAGTPRGGS